MCTIAQAKIHGSQIVSYPSLQLWNSLLFSMQAGSDWCWHRFVVVWKWVLVKALVAYMDWNRLVKCGLVIWMENTWEVFNQLEREPDLEATTESGNFSIHLTFDSLSHVIIIHWSSGILTIAATILLAHVPCFWFHNPTYLHQAIVYSLL